MWREREAGDLSITQDRSRPGRTAARFAALLSVDEYLAEAAPSAVRHAHAAKVFSLDVAVHVGLIHDNGPEYLDELIESAGALALHVSPVGIGRVSPLDQLIWQALFDADVQAVIACGEMVLGRNTNSLRFTWAGSSHLSGPARRRVRLAELRRLRRGGTRRAVARLRPPAGKARSRLRRTAVNVASSAVTTLARPRFYAEKTMASDDTLNAALARAARLERIARRAGRTVGVVSKGSANPKKQPLSIDHAKDGLVGTVTGHTMSHRDDGFLLTFERSPIDVERCVLLHENERIPIEVPAIGGAFSLNLSDLSRFGVSATLRPGPWRVIAIDSDGSAWNVATDNALSHEIEDAEAGARYRIRGDGTQIVATVSSLLPTADRSKPAQALIRDGYTARAASGERARAVLYESYYGRSVGCHPERCSSDSSWNFPLTSSMSSSTSPDSSVHPTELPRHCDQLGAITNCFGPPR
jgi:hypothetical protein